TPLDRPIRKLLSFSAVMLRVPGMLSGIAVLAFISLCVAADVASADGPSCRTLLATFLQEPTDSNLEALTKQGSDKCSASLGLGDYQSLDRLIERGNVPAALFVASHVRQLNNEERENALRALGQFASYHMREFLVSTSGALTDREFRDALTMLPVDLGDDFG